MHYLFSKTYLTTDISIDQSTSIDRLKPVLTAGWSILTLTGLLPILLNGPHLDKAVTDTAVELLGKQHRKRYLWVTLDLCEPKRDLKKMRGALEGVKDYMGQVMRKRVLCHMRTTKAQISLRIRAV